QRIADLAGIVLTAKIHHAGTANNSEVGNLRQLGQKIVLDTVGKGSVLSVVTQIFKWQYCDARRCWQRTEQLAFPNDHANRGYECERQYGYSRSSWISLQPFLPSANNSGAPGEDWFVS